jgi:hypothetical protein
MERLFARREACKEKHTNGNGFGLTLSQKVKATLWPTPHGFSQDGRSNGPSGNELGRAVNQTLWQTPVADDAADRAIGKLNSRGEPKLSAQVKLWPTPSARDWKGAPASLDTLPLNARPLNEVVRFPTPRAIDGRPKGNGPRPDTLTGYVNYDHGVRIGSLNPSWVELLMGLPADWTDLGDRDGKMEPPE